MSSPSRHLPYFSVLEALRERGCPLCRLISRETRRYLDSLLYEFVNDPGFRGTWHEHRGFCHRHSWMLASSGDGLGLAILYQSLIEGWDEKLLEEAPRRGCPVCTQERQSLRGHLGTLADFRDDAEMTAAIEQCDGFCGPHLRQALKTIAHPETRRRIVEVSARRLREVATHLRSLTSSFDYQHAPASDERVKLAWRDAIEKIVGAFAVPDLSENT